MLTFFRRFAKSWFGPVIMGLLLVAFGVLGGSNSSVRGLLAGHFSGDVVDAGPHHVSALQFQKMFQRDEQGYQQQTGQPYPLDQAVSQGLDKDLVQKLASEQAYFEMLSRSGLRPSDAVVLAELKRQAESGNAPGLAQLFDPVTGKFNQASLNILLNNNGLNEDEFQRTMTDGVADDDLASAMRTGFSTPRIYAAVQAALMLESRDVTYFVIPAQTVPQPPPTDAQLLALIQQYKDKLMLPERRKLTVVRFSAKAIAPTMPVDPAAVQQQFDARKDSYGKPELRTFVEIPLNDPGNAAQVQAALNKGQEAESVAKSVGVDAVTYTDQPLSAIADHAAGVAAFGMTAGQVSGPVKGDFKPVILKVLKVTPAQAPDVNAARTQIEADIRQAEAIDKVYELSQKFEDLRQGGASMADAAAKLGLTAVEVDPVGQDGKDPLGAPPNPVLSPKLLTAAFQLPQGGDSNVIADADKGEYFDVRVDQVIAPAPPGLDEKGIRQILTQAYFQQLVVSELQKQGAAAVAAIKGGKTLEAVAAGYKAKVVHQVGMQEVQAKQYEQTLGQTFVQAVFEAKPGQVFSEGSDPLKGLIVARLDAAKPGDPKEIAMVIEALRQRNGQSYLEGLQTAMREAAVKMIKPSTDLAQARTAMGIDASTIAKAGAPSNAAAGGGPGPAP